MITLHRSKGGRPLMRDQTKPEWRSQGLEGKSGTGVFLIIDVTGQKKKTVDANLTYDECKARDVLAFKWVPESIATSDAIMGAKCEGRCRE